LFWWIGGKGKAAGGRRGAENGQNAKSREGKRNGDADDIDQKKKGFVPQVRTYVNDWDTKFQQPHYDGENPPIWTRDRIRAAQTDASQALLEKKREMRLASEKKGKTWRGHGGKN